MIGTIKAWDELPEYMRIDEVRPYYDILRKKTKSLVVKRIFDFVVAVLMLIIISPVMLAVAIAIRTDSKGRVIFKQERVTQYGRVFNILKFRTMKVNADDGGEQLTTNGDARVTKIGRMLRHYRLDELPQLVNIIKGDMSFVGTRPEVPRYVDMYEPWMRATLLLPAGVTSEASIRYKDEYTLLENSENPGQVYIEKILPDKMYYNAKAIWEFGCKAEILTMIRTVFSVFGREFAEKHHKRKKRKLVAVLTNNDDDIYCMRKELIEALVGAGYKVLISCPYGPKFELMNEIPYIYDDPDIDRRGTNILADIRLFLHYRKLFKVYKPNVILTYTAKPNVYAGIAAHQLKIPCISNVTGLGSVTKKTGIVRILIMRLFKLAYSRSFCIMFQNSRNMELAKQLGWVKGDYKLIPGSGVDTERFPLQPYPDGGNGITGEKVVFNYIGRVLSDKRVDDYIEAAGRIKARYPKTEFNIIGFIEPTERHYEDELSELEGRGVIKYRGSLKDVRPYIARAHATIHPSTYGEGISNVLLESASSGRPVITTDNPGCMETLDDGVTGLIYSGGDVDELVSKIELFLQMNNHDRKIMGQMGRKRMKDMFLRSTVIEAYLEKVDRACSLQVVK